MKKIIQVFLSGIFKFSKGKKGLYGLYYHVLIKTLDILEFGNGGQPESSGEIHVLKKIKTYTTNPTIFDCGANKGQYSNLCLKEIGQGAVIHCFEPSSKTFVKLKENLGNKKNIILNNAAVGEKRTKMKLFSDGDTSIHSALIQHDLTHHQLNMQEQEEVDVITIDEYCLEKKITKINLLKLDIEGYEYFALLGAKRILNDETIDMIQFEMGKTNIDSRTYFKDFYKLLINGYKFYRILTWGIKALPEEYTELNELFYCCNYLAVSRSRKELIFQIDQ